MRIVIDPNKAPSKKIMKQRLFNYDMIKYYRVALLLTTISNIVLAILLTQK